jgi:hypothetical protein
MVDGWIQKNILVPSESAPREHSNEWSCQYALTILNFWGNFCVLPLVTEVSISPWRVNIGNWYISQYIPLVHVITFISWMTIQPCSAHGFVSYWNRNFPSYLNVWFLQLFVTLDDDKNSHHGIDSMIISLQRTLISYFIEDIHGSLWVSSILLMYSWSMSQMFVSLLWKYCLYCLNVRFFLNPIFLPMIILKFHHMICRNNL